MSTPLLFFGGKAEASILQAGVGYTDAGAAITLRAESDGIAPAGAGGDCIFHTLYLPITNSMPVTVRVVPILDGVRIEEEVVEFSLSAGELRSAVYEITLSRGYERGGVEQLRSAMQGTWLAVSIEVDSLLDGRLLIEHCEVEYDVISEQKSPVMAVGA